MTSNKLSLRFIILLFIVGFIVFFFRFPQPIITPTIYAEDGIWIGSALSNGWMHTFIHARPDYFVFFNIFFLFIASYLSSFFSGSELLLLPFFIACISYSFYSFTSIVVYITARKYSNSSIAFLAFLMSLFIPLGLSQAESIGTLVQVGFYMPVLSVCFHLFRSESKSVLKRTALDVVIFLMAATNPVNFAITGVYLVAKLFSVDNKNKFIIGMLPLLISLLVLFLIIAPRMNGSGGVMGFYNADNLIEMITARSILYPFIFPFYGKLNDTISIAFSVVYAAFVVFIFVKSEKNIRLAIAMIASTLIIYCVATTAGRSGITGLLNNYSSTYPDRYFMGINILSILLFTLCISQVKNRTIRYIFIAILFVIYILGSKSLFESSQEKRRIALDYVYINTLCNASDEGNGFSRIVILPSTDWYIRVPSQYVKSIYCIKN